MDGLTEGQFHPWSQAHRPTNVIDCRWYGAKAVQIHE